MTVGAFLSVTMAEVWREPGGRDKADYAIGWYHAPHQITKACNSGDNGTYLQHLFIALYLLEC